MEYQQPNTAKRLCKKRLKIGPKIGTNEQIQNSKKKPAVMAFWKKAPGCGIPFLDINCKACSVFTQNRKLQQSTAGLSIAMPYRGFSIILYKNVGTKPFCWAQPSACFQLFLIQRNCCTVCTGGVDLVEGIYITHLIDIGKEKGAREREREREREDGALCEGVRW